MAANGTSVGGSILPFCHVGNRATPFELPVGLNWADAIGPAQCICPGCCSFGVTNEPW